MRSGTQEFVRYCYFLNTHWQGGMTLAQVEMLERTFAQLTEQGWVIPRWVTSLRNKVQAVADRRAALAAMR